MAVEWGNTLKGKQTFSIKWILFVLFFLSFFHVSSSPYTHFLSLGFFLSFRVWLLHLFHCYLGVVANAFSCGFAVADVLHCVINRAYLFKKHVSLMATWIVLWGLQGASVNANGVIFTNTNYCVLHTYFIIKEKSKITQGISAILFYFLFLLEVMLCCPEETWFLAVMCTQWVTLQVIVIWC